MYGFTFHPKDEAIMVKSVLLKDTSAATGQAGIRTHILTTPELESNALDRSATTLHGGSLDIFVKQNKTDNQPNSIHFILKLSW